MGEILTSRLCPHCSILHRKDYDIFGDYNEDGRLQSYCPECGEMHPPITIQIMEFTVSRRKRHKTGTIIAATFGLSFKKMHKVTSELNFVGDTEFINSFHARLSEIFDLPIQKEEIIEYLKGSGKKSKQMGEKKNV